MAARRREVSPAPPIVRLFEVSKVQGRRKSFVGVGIGYSPFLHRTILSRPERFDFVELPLEPYTDEAQRELLDPGLNRIGAIAEARPCLWRGSAFSLGSAGDADTSAAEAQLRRLVARTNAVLLREDLAFRRVEGRDLGLSQPPPFTEALADLAGRRCEAMAQRLPCGFAAGLSLDALSAAGGGTAARFLRCLAAATGQDLAVDLGATAAAGRPEVLAAILDAIPTGRVAQVALTSCEAAVWPVLETVLAATGARSVVIRRTRDLFPLGDLFVAADRARKALDRAASRPPQPERAATPAVAVEAPQQEGVGSPTPSCSFFEGKEAELLGTTHATLLSQDLAATIRDQAAFAARCGVVDEGAPLAPAVAAVQARAVWRERVADLHRMKQLARWAERPSTWRV